LFHMLVFLVTVASLSVLGIVQSSVIKVAFISAHALQRPALHLLTHSSAASFPMSPE